MKTSYDSLDNNEKQKLIEELYIDQQLSFPQIAEQYGTYAKKLSRDAKKFNIQIRDRSESQKNAIQHGAANHPTKGKQHNESTKIKISEGRSQAWSDMDADAKKEISDKMRKIWENRDDTVQMRKKAYNTIVAAAKLGSKLEKFLLQQLVNSGYKVDFHKEHIFSSEKLQIDLFLPELSIAIEVDGAPHIIDIWGAKTLQRNIKSDNLKNGLMLGRDIAIIRIRVNKRTSKKLYRDIWRELHDNIIKIQANFPKREDRLIILEYVR